MTGPMYWRSKWSIFCCQHVLAFNSYCEIKRIVHFTMTGKNMNKVTNANHELHTENMSEVCKLFDKTV